MNDIEIKANLAREEFRLRSLSEAEEKSKAIAEEIKAVLRKHGASLAEWNHNLYIVPTGFQVYSVWNFPYGVQLKPLDVGLTCQRYDCDYRIIKPFPKELMPK
jgi:hypothetical protein